MIHKIREAHPPEHFGVERPRKGALEATLPEIGCACGL